MAAVAYCIPWTSLNLLHHVTPPPSGAFILSPVKYKYRNPTAMTAVTIPYTGSIDSGNIAGRAAMMARAGMQAYRNSRCLVLVFQNGSMYNYRR